VDLILNCYQQRYRNRRRQQQQQQQQMNNGTDEPLLGPKLEDVKEEDTKEDIKEPGGELGGMGSGLVECETLLTVEQETILFSASYVQLVRLFLMSLTEPSHRYGTGICFH
jgi:hypothetical protein